MPRASSAPRLLALLFASTATAQSCGQKFFPVGYQCGVGMRDGDRVYDPSCQNILVCHDGTMQLNNPCSPGRCMWREDAHSVFCAGSQGAADAKDTAVESEHPGCGLVVDAGQKCPVTLKEGGRLCDRSCKNIVVCREGVMETDESCEASTCMTKEQADLGKGAFCGQPDNDTSITHGESVDGPVEESLFCGLTSRVGHECGSPLSLVGQGWRLCDEDCSNIIECRDGRIQFSQACAPGVCAVDDESRIGDAAFCAGDLDPAPEDYSADYDIASDNEPAELEESMAECGPFYGPTGHSCDAQTEGQTFCDFDCKNILICHDGRAQVNNPCGSSCIFNYDAHAAFCA